MPIAVTGPAIFPILVLAAIAFLVVFAVRKSRSKKNKLGKTPSATLSFPSHPQFTLAEDHSSSLALFPAAQKEQAQKILSCYIAEEDNYIRDCEAVVQNYTIDQKSHRVWDCWSRRLGIGFTVVFVWVGALAVVALGVPGLLVWALSLVIAYFVGRLVGTAIDKSKNRAIDRKVDDARTKLEHLRASSAQRIDQGRQTTKESCQAYLDALANASREKSLSYAENPRIQDISQWILDLCSIQIDHAAREKHLEFVETLISFDVYTHQVETILYNIQHPDRPIPRQFNFEENRCANLNTPVQIGALTMAIAQQLQLDLMLKYPEDVTGSPVMIENQDALWRDQFVTGQLLYRAANMNYQPIQSWD